MGFAAVVPSGGSSSTTTSGKRRSKEKEASSGPARKLRTLRKGWTLFILKQNVSCEEANSQDEEEEEYDPPLKEQQQQTNFSSSCHGRRGGGNGNGKGNANGSRNVQQRLSENTSVISSSRSIDTCCSTAGGMGAVISPQKERIRGLASIVQDVLSRSRSDLRREYGTKVPEEHLTAEVVGIETGLVVGRKDSAPEMSLSFRMRLVDRCDTDLGMVASIRNGPSSALGCESSQSCRYPQQRPGDGSSFIGDLLERGKRLGGVEDSPRLHASKASLRCSTADEYKCVVKRLRDPRGTIRLLAATAIREATRNSPQAREDLWKAGAIPPLVKLLQEEDMGICYMATVALLNLAIGSVRNKQDMADCGAIPILVRLMRPDSTTSVRESATTVILSLAASDPLKACIGSSGAIVYLSDILSNGTTQGRSDAVRALLNLSIFKGNRPVLVQSGVISPLYKVILRDAQETAEKAVILLSHLFHDKEGRETISAEEHTCAVLIQVLQRGTFSQTCKEQTVIILLALSAKMTVRREAVVAQGILPSLVEIALIGSSPKIQEKAAKLLRIIKEQRTDQGLSMDRVPDVDDRKPLERQFSTTSTVDTSVTVQSSRRRVTRSASSLSGKAVGSGNHKEAKESKSMSYVRSLFGRSLRSDYLTCRSTFVEESSQVPVNNFSTSFCSQRSLQS